MAETPGQIAELVERFNRNVDAYQNHVYNETQVRREFIDPLFEALGWDVTNKAGYAEAYKDVIHEDAIKIGGATKAPDYCFRIGGARKFFLEAKKPAVNIKDDVDPAYQLRRYAWSAKLPLSILTDFAEFAVYDCRVAPKPADKSSVGRVLYLTYKEYAARWDEIEGVFSREAVLRGSFDKFAESKKGKRGTSQVDAEFLNEIESWREALAKNLALRNPKLSVRDLNFAVQRTIDRIIFLRMCEDRGIENYGQLLALLNGENTYKRLQYLYGIADDKYNSGIFHFKLEKDRAEAPDELTLKLKIDDKVLKDIIRRLYYPESPYEFSVLGADILGNVYEQFLGKVIRLTAGHHAVVEEKPEVKKAGGVYYTPAYIVEYIVKNTVGKLCEGKSPRQIEKLRILDPACGSGSFLIGAYTYLLNYHRDWYVNDGSQKHTKEIYQGSGGQWLLTTQEKKRILLKNIYGVDIDSQAVEVTKLSLLLKVLEGESEETIGKTLKLFRERALPDLGNNIKCGNSLIGPDFYQNQQLGLLEDEDRFRINAFDWNAEFPTIMKLGGFDAVIGNPPYVRIQALKEWAPIEVERYKETYKSAAKGNYDLYVVFVERGLSLLNKNGRLGFILPHKFFNAQYGEPLRGLLATGRHVAEVIHFGDQQVFTGATTYTCLLFLDKGGKNDCRVLRIKDLLDWRSTGGGLEGTVPAKSITSTEWNFPIGDGASLFERLSKMPVKLEDVTSRIFQGIKTSADKIYIVEEIERKAARVKVYSREKEAEYWLEPDLLHPLIKGGDSKRYSLSRTNRLILFPYASTNNDGADLISAPQFKTRYPLTWNYLIDNKSYLENRENGKMRGERWYGYGRDQALDVMPLPKIFTPDIAARASFSLDESGEVFFTGGVAGGYGILVLPEYSKEYVLGLLNSKLLEWMIRQTATQMRGGYYSFESRFIRNLPIRTLRLSEAADKAHHDKIVSRVERMLDLHTKLAAAKNPNDKTNLQREIEVTDRQIDQLVYELYGLTEQEVKSVETNNGSR
jgi:type I restriction-modification system DNA methylase subunit